MDIWEYPVAHVLWSRLIMIIWEKERKCTDDHDLKSFGPLLDYALSFERTLECKDCWAPRSGGLKRVEVVQRVVTHWAFFRGILYVFSGTVLKNEELVKRVVAEHFQRHFTILSVLHYHFHSFRCVVVLKHSFQYIIFYICCFKCVKFVSHVFQIDQENLKPFLNQVDTKWRHWVRSFHISISFSRLKRDSFLV